MDTTGGVFTHRSLAVFDAGGSWLLYLPWEKLFDVFINLFFDLCEMERRAMEGRLQEPGMTLEKARMIHAEHTQRLKDKQRKMMDAVWPRREYLLSWNRVVLKALDVDRVKDLDVMIEDPELPPLPLFRSTGPSTY
jgi:hypothetical protein